MSPPFKNIFIISTFRLYVQYEQKLSQPAKISFPYETQIYILGINLLSTKRFSTIHGNYVCIYQ